MGNINIQHNKKTSIKKEGELVSSQKEASSDFILLDVSKEELENVSFVEEKNNLVLYGPVGIGKTHMAIAAGVNAVILTST